MALYLVRSGYTSTAFQGMLASPSDRGEAAKALFKSLGLKTHDIFFSISSGSIVCLVEGTAEQVTEAQMVTMASGAFTEINVEELISTKAMKTAMTNAAAKAAKYKAPNK
jgi:uncharacterized protein with GYD domain